VAAAVALAPGSSPAQVAAPVGPLQDSRWLPPGSDIAAALSELPARQLSSELAGGRASAQVRLGELAFRAPSIFAGLARETGLSCQTCHANGHLSAQFFVPGLSDRPGSFDPTNALFNAWTDDGLFRPLDIPSLRGIALTAPYARDGRFASLRRFTRHVIVNEFAGPEPPPWLLDALVAYQRELPFPPAPLLQPGGRLSAAGPAAARRGERLFRTQRGSNEAPACASCHPPSANFTDGGRYDVGTGGSFTPPSLRGLAASAPYLHDGRLASLEAVVERYDGWFALGLTAGERADLAAYLRAIGAAALVPEAVSLAGDLDRLDRSLPVLADAIAGEHLARARFVVRALRHELGLMHSRFPDEEGFAPGRDRLVAWSRRLQQAGRLAEQGMFEAARLVVQELATTLSVERQTLEALEADSFYDPARLAAASSSE